MGIKFPGGMGSDSRLHVVLTNQLIPLIAGFYNIYGGRELNSQLSIMPRENKSSCCTQWRSAVYEMCTPVQS